MKHRSKKVNFLSYSVNRKRRKYRSQRYRSWSSSTASHAEHEESQSDRDMEIDVSQILFEDDHDEDGHIQELRKRSASTGSLIPFLDASHWLGVAGDLSLNRLPTTLFEMCRWCKTKAHESLELARDVVFPSRVYWRELHATQEQLTLLEEQLKKVRENMESRNSEEKTDESTDTSCSCNCCPLHSPTNTTSSSTATISPEATATTTHLPTITGARHAPPPLPMPPPPPPPPPPSQMLPPPPPPPPPAIVAPPSLDWRKNLPKKKDGASNNDKKSTQNGRVTISLSDIQGIKLKKVNKDNEKQNQPRPRRSGPLVSLSDLKAVQLKKSSSQPRSPRGGPLVSLSDLQAVQLKMSSRFSFDSKAPQMNLRKRLTMEAADFRTSLKKIGVPRSPGGTPVRLKPAESGVGLTPIMTRALRRKFRSLTTPPSTRGSSRSMDSSPGLFTPSPVRF